MHIFSRIFLFTWLLYVSSSSCFQKIDSFFEAADRLIMADENTLVLFDVDYTITMPGSPMLWPKIAKVHAQWLQELYASTFKKSNKSEEYLRSIWQDQEIPAVVEADVVTIIKTLQNRNVPVFALTAIMTGSHYTIPSLPEWRFKKLQQIGIDFRNDEFPDIIFNEFPDVNGYYPIFYQGILCTALATKGEVLGAFLDRMQWKPSRVIFFDDNLTRLEEVKIEMEKRAIPFIGYHYHGVDYMEGKLDKPVAAFQLNYLVEHEKWIMEDEARILLKQQLNTRPPHFYSKEIKVNETFTIYSEVESPGSGLNNFWQPDDHWKLISYPQEAFTLVEESSMAPDGCGGNLLQHWILYARKSGTFELTFKRYSQIETIPVEILDATWLGWLIGLEISLKQMMQKLIRII